MKSNLKSKRNIPAVAYLSQDQLVLSVFFEGQFQLIQQKFAENLDSRLPIEIKNGTKLMIILSNQLVLYSQLKLPINLSNQEVAELIELQLSQRQRDSQITTYYDYYPLQELEDSMLFGLFEARKDKLDSVIQVLQKHGFKISLIIPQALVVVNQIIQNNHLAIQEYQIISRVDDQILFAHINNEKLIGIKQLDINRTQTDALVYPELLTQLDEFDCNAIISLGLNVEQFNQYLSGTDFKLDNYQSLSEKIEMTQLIINWMREQYGHYKSVALA